MKIRRDLEESGLLVSFHRTFCPLRGCAPLAAGNRNPTGEQQAKKQGFWAQRSRHVVVASFLQRWVRERCCGVIDPWVHRWRPVPESFKCVVKLSSF